MTKAGEQIIEGAKQALEHANCNHDWTYTITGRSRRCRKCKCTEYDPNYLFDSEQ